MANFMLFQINCTVIMRLAQQPKTPPTRAWATAPFTQTAPTLHRLALLPPREETTRRCPHPRIRRAPTAMATERRRRKCWRRMRTRGEITRCTARRIPVQWLATKAITVTTVSWFETFDRISERTRGDATPALLSFLQAGDISSPGENSTVSACIRALEHRTRARTPDTATRTISQHRLSAHSVVYQNSLDKKNVLVPKNEMFFFFFVVYVFHKHAAWLFMNLRCKQVYGILLFVCFLPVLHCSHQCFDKSKKFSALSAVSFQVILIQRVISFQRCNKCSFF